MCLVRRGTYTAAAVNAAVICGFAGATTCIGDRCPAVIKAVTSWSCHTTTPIALLCHGARFSALCHMHLSPKWCTVKTFDAASWPLENRGRRYWGGGGLFFCHNAAMHSSLATESCPTRSMLLIGMHRSATQRTERQCADVQLRVAFVRTAAGYDSRTTSCLP